MKLIRLMMAALMIFSASSAYSIIDVQAMAGKRWMSSDQSGFSLTGTEAVVAGHINPIPLPLASIGFGVTVGVVSWDMDGVDAVDSAATVEVGVEVMASFAIPFLLEPYVRANYTPYSAYAAETTIADETLTVAYPGSGTSFSVGLKSDSMIPLLSFLVEYKVTAGKMGGEVEQGDISITVPEFDTTSSSFLVGLEVGI